MTYMLRDRTDGQVEIVILRPAVVGIMADRDLAERLVAFLKDEEPDLVEAAPPGFAQAASDVAEAEALDLDEGPAAARPRPLSPGLPMVVERPSPPVFRHMEPPRLTETELDRAFARIQGGEKLGSVARDIGVPMPQLRGSYAQHRRMMQKHLADGGQQPCAICQRPFTPSITRLDTCARCAKEG